MAFSLKYAYVHAKSLQLCLTLCSPMDCNPPGFSVHAIFQTRILQWVAMPSSRESSQPRDQNRVSCIAGGFVTAEASREAHWKIHPLPIELIYMHYIQEMSSMRKVQCFGYSLPLGLTTQ